MIGTVVGTAGDLWATNQPAPGSAFQVCRQEFGLVLASMVSSVSD
ncbi:hypothetical protein [Kitasatospora sp. NPDC054795]